MSEVAARIAAAAGDADTLLALAIELAQEVSRLSAEAKILEDRRQRDADRKRRRVPPSEEIRGNPRTSAEITGSPGEPPSPLVSPSFPEPHITPSFPPTPATQHREPEEARLLERAPEARAVIVRLLDGFAGVQRVSWVGRLHGVLDRPPTPTGAELNDALEDMLTKARENWGPAALRAFVRRIRGEGETKTPAPPAASTNGTKSDPVAHAAWMATLALLPKWQRREINADAFAELPAGMRAGISAVGGFQRIAATPDDKRVWLEKDFVAAFHAPTREAQSV